MSEPHHPERAGQRPTNFFWRGISRIELRRGADGKRRREKKTPLSATGTQRASATPGMRPSMPLLIWNRSNRRHVCLRLRSAKALFLPPSGRQHRQIYPRSRRPPASARRTASSTALKALTTSLVAVLETALTSGITRPTTAHLFPSFARSLRKASFGFCMDEAGAMHFRQLLPDGKERSGFAAADGQMGQIVHAYLDWKLSGDRAWLENLWPRIKKAIEFAWIPGGWDANRDGVMEGVQHNTYDVEFYGPNPQCGIYYLAALRACEEMARTLGETDFANECGRLFRERQSLD